MRKQLSNTFSTFARHAVSVVYLPALLIISSCFPKDPVPPPGTSEPVQTVSADAQQGVVLITPDSASIRDVISGKVRQANAVWWGFNSTDVTENLRAAIRSGARHLTIPNVGREWRISGPLYLASRQEIEFERGVVLAAIEGGFVGKFESMLTAFDRDSITLRGNDATVRMRRQDYTQSRYSASEFRHCIWLLGCTNVIISGLRLSNSGGDGILLERGEHLRYCDGVTITNVTCDSNYRQGISVISARNLLMENLQLLNTEGTAPEAGIDFEPNFPDDYLENVILRNSTIRANEGYGVQFWLENLTGSSPPISVRVENCRVSSNGDGALYVSGIGDHGGVRGTVHFAGNVFDGRKNIGEFPNLDIGFK